MLNRQRRRIGSVSARCAPAALVLLGIGFVVRMCVRFEWKLDDAYIAFAYAQNWVQGHGIVFNVGERVEGYTCFLWVALMALGMRLGVDVVTWSTALGAASAAATVGATWGLTRELLPERLRPGAALAALVVAAYPPLAWWSASGMETGLFTGLVTTAMWRHARNGPRSLWSPVCLALASMTRPEGWLLAGVLCLDAIRLDWRRGARYTLTFLVLFLPYYGWRFWYYGYPLPNTFYAKVGHTSAQLARGLVYLRHFFSRGGGTVLVIGGALGACLCARRSLGIAIFLTAYLTYVSAVGGDVFPFHRFIVPVVPGLVALTLAGSLLAGVRVVKGRLVGAAGVALGATALLLTLFLSMLPGQEKKVESFRSKDAIQHGLCRILKDRTAPDEAIATVGVGVIKFCTGRPVIDMVGLTDKHIAHQDIASLGSGFAGHEKYDSHYVLARWPKYIMIPPASYQLRVDAVADMWQQPAFRRHYRADDIGFRRIESPPSRNVPGKASVR